MKLKIFKNSVLFSMTIGIVLLVISCVSYTKKEQANNNVSMRLAHDDSLVVVGANQTDKYLSILKNKNIGIVANQTSVIFKEEGEYTHLVDSLFSLDINITKAFAPEHGFRGIADAGEHIKDGLDTKTGLPIISLYGDNRKPKLKRLSETKKLEQEISTGVSEIDIMVFDLQDVGVRFYTYIGTLHYIMEACAEANIPLLILDRPNPNGHYIDGPILEPEYKSFVGMHPTPIVHGLTIGEYAQMINGEGWLENKIQCDITVIPVKNYTHQTTYSLPIKPSPNLPNDVSINLYSSLCFFEGTNVSIGRGTEKQFQIAGIPDINLEKFNFTFTPQPNFGAKHPKHEGKECYGYDLSGVEPLSEIKLEWLIDFYKTHQENTPNEEFYNRFFIKLAGTKNIRNQIEAGLTEAEIKATWQEGLEAFKVIREKYLIYE